MSSTGDDPLPQRVGRGTVAENLARAIADGHAAEAGDDTLKLPFGRALSDRTMYGGSPWTCRNCYKVKALPRTLREFVAGR